MTTRAPKVTVGLPVYNGEKYVADALDSALSQTFEDFEVLVSDNASTDRTAEICQDYAARDRRVIYTRTDRNVGAAPNFNRVFELARGKYFRWAAHDDGAHPDFLRKCVEVLDGKPDVVLAHSKVRIFDEQWNTLEDYDYRPRTGSPRVTRRFHDLLFVKNNCYEVFGLIRSNVLSQTGWMGNFPVGDRVLLSELAFRGPFYEVPERLFYSRDHRGRSVRSLPTQQERAAWFDAQYEGRITFPEWRTFVEYCRALERSPLEGRDRMMCWLYMLQWLRRYRKRMRRDLVVAAETWVRRALAGYRWAGQQG
jgi:glycosyltransferase involved in cell wall biosynthesis